MRRVCLQGLVVVLTAVSVTQAQGAVIDTRQALAAQQGAAAVARVQTFLARADAQAALVRLGVDPAQAMTRVATLTPEEAERLAQRIETLPAGQIGVVEAVGLVAIVLLVLELIGVTNAFTNF